MEKPSNPAMPQHIFTGPLGAPTKKLKRKHSGDYMKIKFSRFLTILALGAMIFLPGMAMAWISPVAFIENGTDPTGFNHGQFNKIEIFMIDGSVFDAPFIQEASIAGAGWSSSLVQPKYTLVTGPLTSYLGPFTVELPDPSNIQHVLDYFVWKDSALLYAQRLTWDGTGSGGDYNGWSYPILASDGSNYTYDGTSGTYDRAPLPPSLLLLGTGLLGLLGLRRKHRHNHKDDSH
jgi:hypothetical protein